MSDYLAQHPEIFMSVKELHHFGEDIKFRFPKLDRANYLDYFKEAGDEKRIGEAAVWYLYSTTAAREIKEFCPAADIIIMLRDPVDMAYSLHSEFLFTGDEDIEEFWEALNAEADRQNMRRIPDSCHNPRGLQYRSVGQYAQQVERYLDVFGEKHVHIILYDDFKERTAEAYRGTAQFLGVNTSFNPLLDVKNPNKIVHSKGFQRLMTNTPNVVRAIARGLLPQPVRMKLRRKLTYLNARYVSRRPLPEGIRQQLRAEFMPDIKQLEQLIRRDLSAWMR